VKLYRFGQPIKVNWAYASGQREDTTGGLNPLHYSLVFYGDSGFCLPSKMQSNQENIQPAVLYATNLHSLCQGTTMSLLETSVQR
jgi:hypothetical protein